MRYRSAALFSALAALALAWAAQAAPPAGVTVCLRHTQELSLPEPAAIRLWEQGLATLGACRQRTYVSTDPEECHLIRWNCPDGWGAFSDETGCGCELL